MAKDQEFVTEVLKALVNHPEKVKVERIVNELGVLLKIEVDPSDVGGVLGKQGATINALRHLARIVGRRNRAFVSLKLKEDLEQLSVK